MSKFSLLQDWADRLQELVEELENTDDDCDLSECIEHLVNARNELHNLS